MMISTRGRYALRVLIDIAEHSNGEYIPMKLVAERQDISLKYIEQITPILTKNGFVEGVHGKGGGYRLCVEPKNCCVGEILRLTEGDLSPVSCLLCDAKPCKRASQCKTLSMWKEFKRITEEYFDAITIEDLMNNQCENNYVI